MKLAINHLASYYPYKVKLVDENNTICFIYSLHNDSLEVGYPWNVGDYEKQFDEVRLCLRPLSDLTKEIEHNGEKFVPIDVLNEELETNSMQIHEQDGELYFTNVGRNILISLEETKDLLNKLFEWHFDVFNLIEQGLAIDINTLK